MFWAVTIAVNRRTHAGPRSLPSLPWQLSRELPATRRRRPVHSPADSEADRPPAAGAIADPAILAPGLLGRLLILRPARQGGATPVGSPTGALRAGVHQVDIG